MPNTTPIFSRVGDIQWGDISALNIAKDGTGTVVTVFTAAALTGGYVQKLVVNAKGTNVATVLRVWINNGATNTTAANNTLIASKTIAATTLSESAELVLTEILLGIMLPPDYKINVTLGTAIAAGLHVVAIGGKY